LTITRRDQSVQLFQHLVTLWQVQQAPQSQTFAYPLDLIITRLQVQRQLRKSSTTPDEAEYKGVLDAADQIYNCEGGISAFYTGIVQTQAKTLRIRSSSFCSIIIFDKTDCKNMG
jgi:hypothetical protein